ncbi:Innexin inx7 [Atta colombica]|uniref:Innexin n=1 Tax=Atta colombica TaxID=520822 RepID=A0A195BR20_9HYME|nr:PREDICTED: innexin inx7-like [Atta colombica]KYM89301.1 Innexin inx7 [Atta colombica]
MAPGTVLAAFSVLKDHVKFKVNQNSIATDNIIFRLHYRITFLLLLVASILVTSRQFIGEHIRCIADSGVPSQVIETFCFFMSTYTVVKHLNATAVQQGELPHPGVGPAAKDDPVIHHAYYQWVPFILFFQALLFYLPHYLWRKTEGGRLSMLVSGLHMASLSLNETEIQVNDNMKVPSKKERDEKIQQIRIGFINRLHLNRPWAYTLTLCEIMNFINVIMQIYLTDWFLGGAFLGLGQAISEPLSKEKMNPLDIIFPKVTKCIFHKYGPSGTIQKHDALCVMALNIVNEKIYTVLWFWFVVLAVLTGLGLVWRILTMVLHARSTSFNKFVFSMACPGKYNPWNVLKVTHEYYFGDWLFLYYIAKNLDNYVFKELLQSLAEELENKRHARFKILSPEVEQELLNKQWGDSLKSSNENEKIK